ARVSLSTPRSGKTSNIWLHARDLPHRLSSHAVLEPDRPPSDADHRRGDPGRRGRAANGLRLGVDRPASAVACDRVAPAVSDAGPAAAGNRAAATHGPAPSAADRA